MIIKRLIMKNFGRHKELDITLTCGLVGIVGPNGTGKSTITNGIYAALTNDFGRFAGRKDGNITDTAESVEESSIEVYVEHNGQDLRVLRSLRPNRSRLWLSGQDEPLTKSGDIQRELEERLGVNSHILSRFCLVDQWEIFSFLSDTPGERAKIYQRLCGTEHAQDVCDAITEMLQDQDLNVVFEDTRDHLRQQIAGCEADIVENQERVEHYRKRLLSADKLTKAEGVLDRRKNLDADKRLHEQLQIRVDGLVVDVEKSTNAVSTERRGLTAVEAELVETEAAYEVARKTQIECKTHRENFVRYSRAVKQLAMLKREREILVEKQLEGGHHAHHAETSNLGTLRATNVRLSDKLEDLNDQLDMLDRGDEVSRKVELRVVRNTGYLVDDEGCGTIEEAGNCVEHMFVDLEKQLTSPNRIQELELLIATATEDFDNNNEAIDAIIDHNAAVDEIADNLADIDRNIAAGTQEVGDYAEYSDPPDEDAEMSAKAVHDKRARLRIEQTGRQESLSREERILAGFQGNLDSYQQQLTEVGARIEDNFVSDDLRDRATAAIERHRKAEPNVTFHEQCLAEANKRLTQLQADLEAMTARIERTAKARKFADRMQKIRDEVLHRQALPQVVAQTNLEDMESDINEVLDLFGSPFWVEASDDLSFLVHFPGEPPKPAERLSGGQKGILAVAFRIAISSLFKSEIGLMCLDEPTAGMDDRNVSFLAEAMTRFAAEVRDERQIIMITHADQLRASFDQVVDLGDNEVGARSHESEVHTAVNG